MFRLIFILLLSTILLSCNKSKVFEQHHKFTNNTWAKSEQVTFAVDIKEPNEYDIFIAVRHAGYYPFANVIVGLTIETPEGESRFMQHDLIIRNTDGTFKSDGLGDIWDISLPVFENFRMSQKGTYTFIMENRMHLVEMQGIMEMGLIVKHSK